MLLKERKVVKLSRLVPAQHNPPNRIAPKNIAKLADSMELVGLLQPITISTNHTIIEGHRRWAAANQLGWQDIECNIMEECDADLIYASVNASLRPMNGNDSLGVWLKNRHAVMPRTDSNFQIMEKTIGLSLMKDMYAVGLSRAAYLLACKVYNYCDAEDAGITTASILKWFMRHMAIGQVRKAMENGQDPRVIIKAVKQNKPIKMQLTVA